MNNLFKFSIIIPYYNNINHLQETLDSIISQNIIFEENIQIIIIENNTINDSENIIESYQLRYPGNINLINPENLSKTQRIKSALKYAKGQYINILNSGNLLSEDTLINVYDFFEENYYDMDIVSISIEYFGNESGLDILNYKYKSEQVIDLVDNPNNPQISLSSSFIKKEVIKECINEQIEDYDDTILINKILLNKQKLGVSNGICHIRKIYDGDNLISADELIKSYQELIDYSMRNKCNIPLFIQYLMFYDLQSKLKTYNLNDENNQIQIAKDHLSKIIQSFKRESFEDNNLLDDAFKYFILTLYNKDNHIEIKNQELLLVSDDTVVDKINNHNITIYHVETDESNLLIYGNFVSKFSNDFLDIKLYCQNEKSKEIYSSNKVSYSNHSVNINYLNMDCLSSYDFYFKLPLENMDELYNSRLYFNVECTQDDESYSFNPKIDFDLSSGSESYISDKHNFLLFNQYESLLIQPYYEDLSNVNYKFSIIMAVYNSERYLRQAIDSLINQSMNFEYNVQLILVNDGSTDSSTEIIKEYQQIYPKNILLLNKDHINPANARNLGLNYVKGKYVNFMDSDDYISENTLLEVYDYFEKNQSNIDVLTIPIINIDRDTSRHRLNYIFSKTRILDVKKRSNNPVTSVSSSFFKYDAISNLYFSNKLICSEDALFINKVILKKYKYGVLVTPSYYFRHRFDESAISDTVINKKEYYLDRLINFYEELIVYSKDNEGRIPKYVQNLFAYDIQTLVKIPYLNVYDNDQDLQDFWNKLHDILNYMNEDVISKNRKVDVELRSFLVYIRNYSYDIQVEEGNVLLRSDNYLIDKLNRHKLWLDSIKISDGYLNILGHLVSNFSNESIKISLVDISNPENEQKIPSKFLEYQQEDRRNTTYLSIPWIYEHNFDIYVPLNKITKSRFIFEIEYEEGVDKTYFRPFFDFRTPTGLTYLPNFAKDGYMVFFDSKTIFVHQYSYFAKLKFEIKDLIKIGKEHKEGFLSAIFLRIIYMILYPFFKNRKIWIFNDRPFVADDNAIHLFKYALNKQDGIHKYYILNSDCEDYKTLKKNYKNIVANGSFKHKILYLFAEKRITAFLNTSFCNPFFLPKTFDYRKFYANILKQQVYFLQHGVISRDLSTHMRRYNHNVQLIVTSADAERQSFFDIGYNFSEDVVQALGLPRYDNLTTDETKKEIVFMPTWRSQFEKDETIFFNSGYYHSMRKLLMNNELQEKLEEKGYIFKFKPHPELLKFIDSFDIHEKIVMSKDERYQELFRDSSLLITDFSSVIFDFAYLKKPVIYYQPNDDYHYAEAYFDYETMGLGPVIKDENELVNKILEYVDNNCQMEDEYKNRVTSFFKYNDKNNCKRVYDWIYNH